MSWLWLKMMNHTKCCLKFRPKKLHPQICCPILVFEFGLATSHISPKKNTKNHIPSWQVINPSPPPPETDLASKRTAKLLTVAKVSGWCCPNSASRPSKARANKDAASLSLPCTCKTPDDSEMMGEKSKTPWFFLGRGKNVLDSWMHILCSGVQPKTCPFWNDDHHLRNTTFEKNTNKPTKTSTTFFVQLSYHITQTCPFFPTCQIVHQRQGMRMSCTQLLFTAFQGTPKDTLRFRCFALVLGGGWFWRSKIRMGEKNSFSATNATKMILLLCLLRKYTEYTCTFWLPNGS